ncbi:hypothetical protein GCM10027515_09150 [Schumannella luteola]|uniref:Uncharacterized protein n=1 Tax=Schumannella luteola TaxID=472059 RepID=A0A852YFX3_9MICO|nr:hypothetical protein [Schumannella luteola]NYG97958.1 hypothetical protein [Schumannella luteola]TPX01699.1 hypothetical protein FJ656_25180 [Schumannella luteola]
MTDPAPREVAEVLATTPRDALLWALLENLARGIAAPDGALPQVRLLRRFDDGHHQQVAAWPDDGAPAAHGEADEHPVHGVGVLEIRPPADLGGARRRRLLDETCVWLAATVRAARAMRTLDRARRDAEQREKEAERAEVRAARVREGERIRLVETITTATVHDLAALRALLAKPADAVEWPAIHASAEQLIADLRDAVRGVFPAMLPDRGAEETLRELAAALPVPIDVTGGLGRRAGWDIESGFYHAVAGTLTAVARMGGRMSLRLRRADALVARIGSAQPVDAAHLTHALTVDAERIASLGGALVVREVGEAVEVEVTMPDRSEVTSLPIGNRQIEARPVHGRVGTLVEVAGLPADELEACRDALAAPVTLLVVQGPLPAPMPGVQTVLCDAAPDTALAAEIRDRDGRWGVIDAVVCALTPRPGFAAGLGAGQLLFRDGVAPAEAVAALAARAPVLAARRVLERLATRAAAEDSAALRWQIDELRAGAHELAEDALLDDVARGRAPDIVDAAAARLAGADGGEAHVRLGLPADADPDQLHTEALAALARWQQVVATPGGAARRRAAEVLERSAAGLVARSTLTSR